MPKYMGPLGEVHERQPVKEPSITDVRFYDQVTVVRDAGKHQREHEKGAEVEMTWWNALKREWEIRYIQVSRERGFQFANDLPVMSS